MSLRTILVLLLLTTTLTSLRSADHLAQPDDQRATLTDRSVYGGAQLPARGASEAADSTVTQPNERNLLAVPMTTPVPLPTPLTATQPSAADADTADTAQEEGESEGAADAATATIEPCRVTACTTPTPQPEAEPPDDRAREARDMLADDTRDAMQVRANATWQALQDAFFDSSLQQYREFAYGNGWPPYAYLWPLSQVVAAGNDLTGVPHAGTSLAERQGTVIELLALTERYFNADAEPAGYSSYLLPPFGEGGDRYYDDNVWLGLELVRAYEQTGHPVALERAQQVLTFMLSGWDSDPAHYAMGGIAWIENDNNGNRNTVSTAPTIELALRLYQHTDDSDLRTLYWSWATRMYAWMTSNLQGPDGMFYDHVRADGIIDTTLHSYNQGAMIGANLAMYQVSGEQVYLDRAVRLADVSVAWFRNGGRDDQPIAFNALYFRRLLLLHTVLPHQAWLDLIVDEADLLWEQMRDEDTDLMLTSSPLTLLDQAAAVQIFAMLAGYGLTPADDAQASAE